MRVFSTQNRTRVQIPDQPGASGNVWDNKPSGFFHAASAKLVGDLGERSRSGGTRNRSFRGGDSLGWMLRIGTVIRIRCASSRGWGYFGVGHARGTDRAGIGVTSRRRGGIPTCSRSPRRFRPTRSICSICGIRGVCDLCGCRRRGGGRRAGDARRIGNLRRVGRDGGLSMAADRHGHAA